MRELPNRIIKETIRTSKKVNQISDFDFRLWVYLITYVDDYGRGSADTELLRSFLFPRRKDVTEARIEKALAALSEAEMLTIYMAGGERYLCFPNWEAHQTIRNKKSKFPEPEIICNQLNSIESKCLRNPIQSESNPNPNPKGNPIYIPDKVGECVPSRSDIEVEFDQLWELYPRKEGRKKAIAAYQKARKDGTTFEEVKAGIINYCDYIRRDNVEPQYVAYGSTWFNGERWKDEHIVRQKTPTLLDYAKTADLSAFGVKA